MLVGDSQAAGETLYSSEFESDSPGNEDRDAEEVEDWVLLVEDMFDSSEGVSLVAFISLLIDTDILFHLWLMQNLK